MQVRKLYLKFWNIELKSGLILKILDSLEKIINFKIAELFDSRILEFRILEYLKFWNLLKKKNLGSFLFVPLKL